MEKLNVATKVGTAERKRIPMSVPVQRLSVPDIPGYHLHWFNGTPERIARAVDGGYEFVYDRDIKLNAAGLGGDSTQSGNTDLGSQVSVAGGEVGKDGQAIRLILMKIKQEWYEEDQQLISDQNEKTAAALRGGQIGGAEAADRQELHHRYVDKARTKIPDLFIPKRPKAA